MNNLQPFLFSAHTEAGCDEAGRGCLAGVVVAAAVILPDDFFHHQLNDSKKVSANHRLELRHLIIEKALAYGIGLASVAEIDKMNILNASFLAMHRAIEKLSIVPQLLLIDGNRFHPYLNISHRCIIGGDAKFRSIAAASILAKTERDSLMCNLHADFPMYNWKQNKGYPTLEHRNAIAKYGTTIHHRTSFNMQIPIAYDEGFEVSLVK